LLSNSDKLHRKQVIDIYIAQGADSLEAIYDFAAYELGMQTSALKVWAHREAKKGSVYAPEIAKPAYRHPDLFQPLVEAEEIAPAPIPIRASFPKRNCYILTAAQDDTDVNMPFWNNLLAYADYKEAQIFVGGFTYQKGLFEDHAVASAYFRQEVREYLNPHVTDLSPNIVWYGRFNRVPTAPDPLSGWDTQTREKWMVAPHAKIALKSIPVMPESPRKQIMSTGVVTIPNYVQRDAGQKAEFHHTYGATIVEIDGLGRHYCRQLHATSDGEFQDLDIYVSEGRVTTGHRVEAITWGDLHRYVLDPDVALGSWGFSTVEDRCLANDISMLDVLRPREQHFHDSFDFYSRSHHTRDIGYERQRRIGKPIDEVEWEIAQTAHFLGETRREWSQTVHVGANHNVHFEDWLEDPSGQFDTINAPYWHEWNSLHLRAGRAGLDDWILHAEALKFAHPDHLKDITFLKVGKTHKICGDIECGLHGHKGPSGTRGTVVGLSKIVERLNIADKHAPAIREGLYCAGTSSKLLLDYNQSGPGAWDHSHIVTYPNSKRTIVTMNGSNWHA
jgi:hypothetical protein